MVDAPKKAVSAFRSQRVNARRRGIEWCLTLAEWWRIWVESGRWLDRGRGRGKYVMARRGDGGAYSADNVSIILGVANARDAFENKPYLGRAGRIGGPTGVGGGRGWYFRENRRRPYQAVFRGKYIGSFLTSEEARAAYVAHAERYLQSVAIKGA